MTALETTDQSMPETKPYYSKGFITYYAVMGIAIGLLIYIAVRKSK